MNKPDDFDCWRLPDDGSTQKVTVQNDTKVPNAAMLMIEREDHTVGNLLRMQLLDDEQVLFSGYRVPHPLEPAIQLKVQTRTANPGPVQAVDSSIGALQKELGVMRERFRAAVKGFDPKAQS